MQTHHLTNSRFVPAIIWGWAALQLATLVGVYPYLIPAVPLAVVLGATVARPATRYVFAVVVGFMASTLAAVVFTVVPSAALLWLPMFLMVTVAVAVQVTRQSEPAPSPEMLPGQSAGEHSSMTPTAPGG